MKNNETRSRSHRTLDELLRPLCRQRVSRLRFAFDDVVNYARLARFNTPLVLRLRSLSCSQPLTPFQRTGCRFTATFIYKYAIIWKYFQDCAAENFRGLFIEIHSNRQTNIILISTHSLNTATNPNQVGRAG